MSTNPIIPIITQAGLTAVFNAASDGLQARITHVALGSGQYLPTDDMTALHNEVTRVPVADGRMEGDHQLHVTFLEDGTDEYWVGELGFYLENGALLALWSHETQPLTFKSASTPLHLAFDLALTALPAQSVSVTGTGQSLNLSLTTELVKSASALSRYATALLKSQLRHIQFNDRLLTMENMQ
ncbi:phage tail protein [Magnetofaba australis]|uniref:Putative pyocin R2 PP, tail fiber protein n=1 Tax=Magnetofaba australis IT-1 TaxID=1434232 RepID=A0A1Y2K1W9_9PROT|nr:phage tail protein [Magnetofaba australis]OSM01657.1 putative pyocin R2 PP, tail fiber protein [Magnetofaba australis IT-1]